MGVKEGAMKRLILIYECVEDDLDDGESDYTSRRRILGFEGDDPEVILNEIDIVVAQYQKDISKIEAAKLEVYADPTLNPTQKERKIEQIEVEPYKVRHGSYSVWVGEFITYELCSGFIYRKYRRPSVMLLDDWFAGVSAPCKSLVLH